MVGLLGTVSGMLEVSVIGNDVFRCLVRPIKRSSRRCITVVTYLAAVSRDPRLLAVAFIPVSHSCLVRDFSEGTRFRSDTEFGLFLKPAWSVKAHQHTGVDAITAALRAYVRLCSVVVVDWLYHP